MRAVVLCLLLPLIVCAQSERGSITGAVSDPANAVVPGAVVIATNSETAVAYQTVTTQTGDYTIAQLPPGMYDLQVEVPGFKKYVLQGIRIYVAQAVRADVVLQV